MNVSIVMIDKIKDIIEDIKDTIEWIAAGCPKPQPIKVPAKGKEAKDERKKRPR